jgi:cytosine/uracil/thiamine/allantoin permease
MMQYAIWQIVVGMVLVEAWAVIGKPAEVFQKMTKDFSATQDWRKRMLSVGFASGFGVAWLLGALLVFSLPRAISQPDGWIVVTILVAVAGFLFWLTRTAKTQVKNEQSTDD